MQILFSGKYFQDNILKKGFFSCQRCLTFRDSWCSEFHCDTRLLILLLHIVQRTNNECSSWRSYLIQYLIVLGVQQVRKMSFSTTNKDTIETLHVKHEWNNRYELIIWCYISAYISFRSQGIQMVLSSMWTVTRCQRASWRRGRSHSPGRTRTGRQRCSL